jgi:hypothetical protein
MILSGSDPRGQRAIRSFAVQGVFSPERLEKLVLSDIQNPFAKVKLDPVQDARYRGGVDAEELVRAAVSELDPEKLKAFLLSIGAGLRRTRWINSNGVRSISRPGQFISGRQSICTLKARNRSGLLILIGDSGDLPRLARAAKLNLRP